MKAEMNELVTRIHKVIKQQANTNEIHSDTALADIGISSLGFIRMIIEIEEECRIRFEDDEIDYSKFSIVRDIELYVTKRMQS